MKRSLQRLALFLAATLTLMTTAALPATAITGGEPDGNRHPNVGLIAAYYPPGGAFGGGIFTCSATLISPTILLTAGHCTSETTGAVLVTFKSFIAEDYAHDIIPEATDPALGYTPEELEAAGFLWGTAITHPDFGASDAPGWHKLLTNWNDVGIIVLNEPVTEITPATLAPEGYLDQLKPSVLNQTIFELVGYGTEVRKPESGPQKPQPKIFPNFRRYTTSPGQKLTPQILQLQGNPNDNRGGGGTCFGDSGGPVFLNGYLVAVTSYGNTLNCRYIDGAQRVDIPIVRDWLDPYL